MLARLLSALAGLLVLAGCAAAPSATRWWRPRETAGPFIYQLQASSGPGVVGGVALRPCARGAGRCSPPAVYDIDLYEDSTVSGREDVVARAAVAAIHRRGGVAVCYVDAGTWESWRPDAGRFPRAVLGRPDGWPGERWLDIRQLGILLPIMEARARRCQRAGFQAIDWDNVDGFDNRTGFPLTAAEQLRYDRSLAGIAHRLGLAAGLKNDYQQVGELAGDFDFAVDEQCLQYQECQLLEPFVRRGKPVYDVEYLAPFACPAPAPAGIWFSWQAPALRALPWRACPARMPNGEVELSDR
jgi:hypothetical protein